MRHLFHLLRSPVYCSVMHFVYFHCRRECVVVHFVFYCLRKYWACCFRRAEPLVNISTAEEVSIAPYKKRISCRGGTTWRCNSVEWLEGHSRSFEMALFNRLSSDFGTLLQTKVPSFWRYWLNSLLSPNCIAKYRNIFHSSTLRVCVLLSACWDLRVRDLDWLWRLDYKSALPRVRHSSACSVSRWEIVRGDRTWL